MRIIYLGTPNFAIAPLVSLHNSEHEIVAVVTQPDRLGNRNKAILSPVKQKAIELNLSVIQYDKISREGVDTLRSFNADIMVTCAFGQILSNEVLAICPHGVINIHASLLPKYRGSCPINKAIICGEKVTGVTIMQTVREIDAGDIISMAELVIMPNESAGELLDRLSILGADIVVSAVNEIASGRATFIAQDHGNATHCKMLSKADGNINFNTSAQSLHDFIRGMSPWPSAQTVIGGVYHKILSSEIVDMHGVAGEVLEASPKLGIIIAAADKAIKIGTIQAAGTKSMSSESYMLGHKVEVGSIIGE